jgi:hypothetical protein
MRGAQTNKPFGDGLAGTLPLMAGMHGDITALGAIAPISQGAAGADQAAGVEDSDAKVAVVRRRFRSEGDVSPSGATRSRKDLSSQSMHERSSE